ncbi:hypothetical protein SLEP1_g2161 [Rubroshorea leprosula]|uniref:Uncharacterized protein n=1 Tax=Rubroshorea leprosula TaxID=152421 RepID=A0AAV5HNG1_9ROSI|nr:hypothetical protein SLEP1_g2161 [Rubroshorea leprosula]
MGFEGDKEARVTADGACSMRSQAWELAAKLTQLRSTMPTPPSVTFSMFGVLDGGVYNIFGPRITLALGCSTYVLYAGFFLHCDHYHNQAFTIVAGPILGIGAGLLWAGEGAIMTSYLSTARKGSYISLFWTIFNLGGEIGRLTPFVLNYHRTKAETAHVLHVYRRFPFFSILHPSRVFRNDESRCTNIKYSSVSAEAVEILRLLEDASPAGWASNFFYSYHFNDVNGLMFNLRTRGLNNVLDWGAQIIGSIGLGQVLEFSFESRRRELVGISTVALLGTAIWGGGLANQLNYSYHELPDQLDFKTSEGAFAGPFVLHFSHGLLDSMFQSLVYWVNGALAEDSETLSRHTGFYKGVQSAGSEVSWQVHKNKVPLLNQLIVNWSPHLG